ncbi:MAG: 30S ribosomal protein S1 [Thermodesulfovibrionales bacterium]|nr:30S ribosomal protein S1 [Thermodesulfovibrionales bacterium]
MTVQQIGGVENSSGEELLDFLERDFHTIQEGEIVKGRVIAKRQDGIIVDIGYKSEGFIPQADVPQEQEIKAGDEIEVFIQEILDGDGIVLLSYQKARRLRAWQLVEQAQSSGGYIEGKIIEKTKGGFIVDISGLRAFLPLSHTDLSLPRNQDQYIGITSRFKIINVNKKKNNIVLSRKEILQEEKRRQKELLLERLKPGALVKGIVKNITDYGVFIDLGGIDGLLHISDISWSKINHPSEYFKQGDRVEVMVLKFEPETEKVTLGYKQKKPDPWLNIDQRYASGQKIKGRVISITDYGAFVRIEDGIDGLIHVSEMDWSNRPKHPSKYVSPGETVDVVILNIDKAQRKLSLSLRRTKPNPWQVIAKKYKQGDIIEGRVSNITDFGVFVELPEGIDGLIHISDLSWTRHFQHPSEIVKRGQKIEAVILNIQPEKEKLSLGLKQLTEDPWLRIIPERYKLGDEVNAKVIKITEHGIFVDIDDLVEGLVFASEIPKDIDKTSLKSGDTIRAWIIKIDRDQRKIGLSLRKSKSESGDQAREESRRS